MNLWKKVGDVVLVPVGVILRVVMFFLPTPKVRIVEDADIVGYFVVEGGQEKTVFDGTSCPHGDCWTGHKH